MSFRLTYATMFDPPAEMHERFEAALVRVSASLDRAHALFINGRDQVPFVHAPRVSPIDRELALGRFPVAQPVEVEAALAAAQAAFPSWRATPMAERLRLLRRVADLMEERVYDIAAALVLEVGKNRMEALGEAQETVDFFRCYADDFAAHDGYELALPDDPLPGCRSHNRSVMRPYGAWLVIAPFNFPLALAGGPAAAALVTGNTVVAKTASDTPWAGRLLADCIRDAGLPPGVFNWISGSGSVAGHALVQDPRAAGVTFTGSVAVGRQILAALAAGPYPRPCIAEMGGKNPCIVTQHADLERATAGIIRSAYGMGGQKCSALSRLYVHEAVADELLERLARAIVGLAIGDPRRRENWLGPVIHARAQQNYRRAVEALAAGGATLHRGGRLLTDGVLGRGCYVEPVLAEAPPQHPLWREELFLPILMLQRCRDRDEAMRLANDTALGLTAGIYGSADDVAWFHEHIEAGVTYANRPQGATTGAWPGYQPFGGWKGSGTTGKAIASAYYLPLYLREQSRTVVE
ncbi:MAG: aldehyde dehydrogenase family protein [Gammaproteobacteria bacterium]|nr:aldehyde dehydrogenase family protein [Gammaproteobacteria bacterium]